MTRRNDIAYDMTSVISKMIDKMYREDLGRKIKAGKMRKANKDLVATEQK